MYKKFLTDRTIFELFDKKYKKNVDKEHIVLYNTDNTTNNKYERGGKMKKKTFKDLRLDAYLTQEQLANKSGFSKDYISMIERGERNPSDKAKIIFANILGVTAEEIFLAVQRTISTIKK